ncbi:hypothetical protein GWI33_006409 [Rhynchophorus ferrugineus]|uniref:Uncharacterized protein n=1 Tax=Rhynchophorus ferrugineus TaxID=354439 RepID=A0A834IUN0_RHYFE|nr:hypothetical protein GWI33_006409 [Rhynchophorus ferrugineus]
MYSIQISQVLMMLHQEVAKRYSSYSERYRRETIKEILLHHYNVDLRDIDYYYLLDKTEQEQHDQQENSAYSYNYFAEREDSMDYGYQKSSRSSENNASSYPHNCFMKQMCPDDSSEEHEKIQGDHLNYSNQITLDTGSVRSSTDVDLYGYDEEINHSVEMVHSGYGSNKLSVNISIKQSSETNSESFYSPFDKEEQKMYISILIRKKRNRKNRQ